MTAGIPAFWLRFRQHAADLASAASADSPTYDLLLEQLQKIHPGLYLEFAVEPDGCELIVTADGDRSLFPLVRTIVDAAPVIDGCTLRALKPKLGFPEVAGWDGVHLRIADMFFQPLGHDGSNELGLRIFIRGLTDANVDDAHNAVLRALDHGLGEEVFAESVHHTEVRGLPPDGETERLIPLGELEAYIEWRKRRRQGAGG